MGKAQSKSSRGRKPLYRKDKDCLNIPKEGQMGAGVVKLEQDGTQTRFHINPGRANQHMATSSAGGQCQGCDAVLPQIVKKMVCKDCGRTFCNNCSLQHGHEHQCKKCNILLCGHFTRSQLLQWKVKDLKCLLTKQSVNTSKCKEKSDLIDLIFSYFGNTSDGYQSDENNTSRNTVPDVDGGTLPRSTSFPETSSSEVGDGTSVDTETPRPTHQPEPASAVNTPTTQLDQIQSEEEIDSLNNRALKRLLVNNFVDFKGCRERSELLQRVKRLWNENQVNKKKADGERGGVDNEYEICKICMDAAIDCVLLECGHMVSCTKCGKQLSECPICRQFVVRAVHTFRA
ncbi:RNF34-like protein [Mya arenaria]|uniref:RNF34-like protein n=1 Tax=Mya arenaria TaxID=6604 RepID=A0ABY7E9G4_MYAAR|nr:RNF34-like protein [Mya arenaria]